MTKLRDKRLFLLDMDGTLYIGDRLFDGVPEFLRHVRSMGGRYLFLTNNSSRGVEGYIEKLRRLGIESAPGDYLTSVDATIRYLKAALPGKTCYIFGTDSFLSQLDRAGIPVTRDREQAEVLLCGFDTELTFQKLEDACILLNRGVPFVATNPDWVCAGLRQRDRNAPYRDGPPPEGHRQAPAGDGPAGHGTHGLFPGADGAAGGPAVHRRGLRRQRRHRHRVRPVRRGHHGGHRHLPDPSHLGVSRYRYSVP